VKADFVLSYDVLSIARDQSLYLMARLTAGSAPEKQARLPLNLSVVLDRSGSMAGEKLEYVKKATQFLVQHLAAQDTFSLVTYDTKVSVNLAPCSPVHKDTINRTIDDIKAGDTTNLSGGWLQGCQLVLDGRAEQAVNRVLLLTDGLANVGITDVARLKAMARQKRDEGATTTAIGVGMDFYEDLLVSMASEGGGAFYFIDNPDRTALIFAEELRGLLSVVGQNLLVTLTLGPQARMVRQLNAYPEETHGGSVSYRLGDIFADEVKTLLLELYIPALATLGQVQVGSLRFEYDEVHEDKIVHQSLELPILVNVAAEADTSEKAANAEVTKAALLLRAARARDESIRHADAGAFDEARDVLARMADEIGHSQLDDEEIQAEHRMLLEEALDMELGDERYDAYTRKASTSKSHSASVGGHSYEESEALHARLKFSRMAFERQKMAPVAIEWDKERRELTGAKLRIGSAPENDIVIAQGHVAPFHCEIVPNGDDYFLTAVARDLPTFANGGRVGDRFRLSSGDIVTVGKTLFRLQ
jgi:Ca-activated chloride channel family protein